MKTFCNFVTALTVACALMFGAQACAQESVNSLCSTRATCNLAVGQSWANANQVWIFSPIAPNVSILIYLHNNNPTSAHNQTIQVFQTESTLVNSLTSASDQWAQDGVSQNTTVGASCNSVNASNKTTPGASGKGTCYVVGMFAAQVAVRITGATTQAGAPDTFDLTIVQSVGYPGGPQPGSSSNGSAAVGTGATQVQGAGGTRGSTDAIPIGIRPVMVGCLAVNSGSSPLGSNGFQWPMLSCDYGGQLTSVGASSTFQSTLGVSNLQDPCASNGVQRQTAFANITTATTTGLINTSGSQNFYICQIVLQLNSTTASTIKFVTDFSNNCPSPTTLTATYTNSTLVSEPITIGGGGNTAIMTPGAELGAGSAFCAITTVGTSPTIPVTVTFVQL